MKLIILKLIKFFMSFREIKKETKEVENKNQFQFIYNLETLELTKEEIEFLLNSISVSKIEGKKIQFAFNLTLKLQYKLNKILASK
jgi:hypothetical protein